MKGRTSMMARARRATALVAVFGAGLIASAFAAEHPPLPKIGASLPQSAESYAFNSTAHQNVQQDLRALGYREDEYLIQGRARVFDWVGATATPVVLAEGTYTTRVLI